MILQVHEGPVSVAKSFLPASATHQPCLAEPGWLAFGQQIFFPLVLSCLLFSEIIVKNTSPLIIFFENSWQSISFTHLDSGSEIKSYLVRLLTYLPGRPIAEIPVSPQLLYEIGRLAAKLDKALEVRFGVLFCLKERQNKTKILINKIKPPSESTFMCLLRCVWRKQGLRWCTVWQQGCPGLYFLVHWKDYLHF